MRTPTTGTSKWNPDCNRVRRLTQKALASKPHDLDRCIHSRQHWTRLPERSGVSGVQGKGPSNPVLGETLSSTRALPLGGGWKRGSRTAESMAVGTVDRHAWTRMMQSGTRARTLLRTSWAWTVPAFRRISARPSLIPAPKTRQRRRTSRVTTSKA